MLTPTSVTQKRCGLNPIGEYVFNRGFPRGIRLSDHDDGNVTVEKLVNPWEIKRIRGHDGEGQFRPLKLNKKFSWTFGTRIN